MRYRNLLVKWVQVEILSARPLSARPENSIPFEMWRDVFINDGEPDLVRRSYAQLSSEPFGRWAEPLKMETFQSLRIPPSFLVGTADVVMPPGDSDRHPRMSSRLGKFRLVPMPGSHEAIFTNPIGLAYKFIEAGRDSWIAVVASFSGGRGHDP
jgi:hypothetical protein